MKRMPISCVIILVSLACLRPTTLAFQPELTDAEQQDLATLVKDLDSDDSQTLLLALQRLLAMGPKATEAVDALAKLLNDERQLVDSSASFRSGRTTVQVNVRVVWVLRSIGPQAVPALVTALKNKDEQVRLPAMQALSELQQPVMLEVWLEALQDSNRYVRIYAARELAKSKSPAAVDALCKVLQDVDMDVRIEVAEALGRIGSEMAIGPLIEGLPAGEVNISLEFAVGVALAKIGEPAVKVLLERFEGFDENERRMVNMAIREIDTQQTRPLLLECLRNEHWQVREAAIDALARLKTPESLHVVIDSVEDPDWNVRWTVARLLGKLADDKSAGAIRPLLLKMAETDPEAKVRNNALWALYSFPGIPTDDYWKTLEAALHDTSPRVRATAACSCSKFPNARFGPRLKELLDDPDRNVRAESAAALGHSNVVDAVPDLIRQLDDEDLRCVSYAALSLGKLGTDEAIAALVAKLRDTRSDDERRGYALTGLCFTANPKAIEPLSAALEDRALSRYRLQVKNALRKLGQD